MCTKKCVSDAMKRKFKNMKNYLQGKKMLDLWDSIDMIPDMEGNRKKLSLMWNIGNDTTFGIIFYVRCRDYFIVNTSENC